MNDCDVHGHDWRPRPAAMLDGGPGFECLNCPSRGEECPDCEGTGFDDRSDEAGFDNLFDDGVCETCDGPGVLAARPALAFDHRN